VFLLWCGATVILLAPGMASAAESAGTIAAVETLPNGQTQPYDYKLLQKAKKPWLIGVSVPHLKDAYWLAVNYGVMDEAKRLGVSVIFLAANGYTDITGQVNAINNLVSRKVDALLVGAISAKSMAPQLKQIRDHGTPVVGFINPIGVDSVTAARFVSFVDSGAATGQYVLKQANGAPTTVALFPGPGGSGWAEDEEAGFRQAVKGHDNIKIIGVKYGDTNKAVQQNLIQNFLLGNPTTEYLIGNPPAALAATTLRHLDKNLHVVANIASPPVVERIQSGKILMTPTDWTVQLARMSLDTAVRILQGEQVPSILGTRVGTIDTDNINSFTWSSAFAPKDYKPIFDVKAH
jgi:protein TorT